MNKNLLIIFVKNPVPGRVKTRLQPDLNPDQSHQLYKAMTEDLVDRLQKIPGVDFRIFFSPAESKDEVRSWLFLDLEYSAQAAGDLGDKMHAAFKESAGSGYRSTVIIGSDLPTLDVSTILEAFERLQTCDLVLGPSEDGGYYLIGLNKPHERLFENVVWSTDSVLTSTVENAERLNWRVELLSIETDIDSIKELRDLFAQMTEPGVNAENLRNLAPRTWTFIKQLPL